jgi:hypothetical protein
MRDFALYAIMALPMVLAGPIAAPASRLDELRESNRVTQVKAGRRNKFKLMQKAYMRYAIAVPPAILAAATEPEPNFLPIAQNNAAPYPTNVTITPTPTQSGTVSASPEQYDEAYLSPVTVGRMNMNLDFDTGKISSLAVMTSR